VLRKLSSEVLRFLVAKHTWNLKHIMNADVIEKLIRFNEKHGIYIPKICTPEIFMGGVENGRK